MKKAILIFLAFFLFYAQSAFADNMATKLGRGVSNIASCWVEIPKQIVDTTQQQGPVSGTITGPIKGVVCTVGRCLAGVYDTATFLLPMPAGYKSLIQPEYVLSPQDGEYKGF